MTRTELLAALRWLKVETGSIACLGCGHEHNCGIHGCAILREAEAYIRGADRVVGPYEHSFPARHVGAAFAVARMTALLLKQESC